jgi:hypothetical protein
LKNVFDGIAPDRVAGEVEGVALAGVEEVSRNRSHLLGEFACSMLRAGAVDGDVSENSGAVDGANVFESVLVELIGIFGLAEDANVLPDCRCGGVIPVVAMRVRYKDGRDSVEQIGDGDRERDERIAAIVGGILDRSHRGCVTQHWIDEEIEFVDLDAARCVTDELNVQVHLLKVSRAASTVLL